MNIHDGTQPLTVEEIDNFPEIDYRNIKKAALVLRALNHKLRAQIVKALHESKRITVTELYTKLQLEQSVASQHLAILRKAGVVSTERHGRNIFYVISPSRIKQINAFVKNLMGN